MVKDWWGSPRKITNQLHHRKISWLELFSDLVYVVIIHSLTTGLGEHFNLQGLFLYVILFLFIFNSWNNMALYFDLHGNQSIRNTVFAILQVIIISYVALAIPEFLERDFTRFAFAYLISQCFITYLWATTARYDPSHRLTTMPYVYACSFGAILLVATIFCQQPQIQLILLVVTLIIDLGILIAEQQNFNHEFKERHINFELSPALLERYGQFTMIVLGESLAGLIEQVSEHQTSKNLVLFLLMIISVIAIWWLYYSLMDDTQVIGHAYWQLALFRGTHILFILLLTFQTFFLDQLVKAPSTLIQRGYAGTTVAVLWVLFRLSFTQKRAKNIRFSLIITGFIASIVILLAPLLGVEGMILVTDMGLIGVIIVREWQNIKAS